MFTAQSLGINNNNNYARQLYAQQQQQQQQAGLLAQQNAQAQAERQQMNDMIAQKDAAYQQSLNSINYLQAEPYSVLGRFYDTPEMRMIYGGNPAFNDRNSTLQQQFQADPSYQFQQTEGMNQMQRASASKGMLNGGPLQKALLQYSQDLANTEFGGFRSRLLDSYRTYQNNLNNLMGQGQAATQNTAANAMQTGTNLATNAYNTGSGISQLYQTMSNLISQNNMTAAKSAAESNMNAATTQATLDSQSKNQMMQTMGGIAQSIIGAAF